MILFRVWYYLSALCYLFFFFQAEDGIRDIGVTGVQTCALPIWKRGRPRKTWRSQVEKESRSVERDGDRNGRNCWQSGVNPATLVYGDKLKPDQTGLMMMMMMMMMKAFMPFNKQMNAITSVELKYFLNLII